MLKKAKGLSLASILIALGGFTSEEGHGRQIHNLAFGNDEARQDVVNFVNPKRDMRVGVTVDPITNASSVPTLTD